MTLAGRKFSDIYDSGEKTLAELEEQATGKFKQVREEHTGGLKQSAEKSSQSLEDKSNLLQSELKQFVDASLKRLQDAVTAEASQNQAFTNSLVTELNVRTEQMKTKLSALCQSHQENVDFASGVACEDYASSVETARIDMEGSTSQALQGLAAHERKMSDSLQQTFEQSLWRVRVDAKEGGDTFLIVSKEQAEAVSLHSLSLVQTLLTNGQSKIKEMETYVEQVGQEIESSIRTLLDTANSHAAVVEKQVNEQHNGLAGGYLQSADTRLSDFADELSVLHDTTTEELVKETDQLSSQLLSGSAKVQEELRSRCDQAVKTVNGSFNTFKLRLEEHLQLSRGQKQALEKDKNRILVAVQNELLSIQDSFSKKIIASLNEAKLGLDEMTESVEKKIVSAVESCNQQISASATSIQKQINDDLEKFLESLSTHHKAALAEICTSAQGNLPVASSIAKEEKPTESQETLFSTVSNMPEPNKYNASARINENEPVKEYQTSVNVDLDPTGESDTDGESTIRQNKTTRRNRKLKNEEIGNEDTGK